MKFQFVAVTCALSFIGGVVAWHFFHTKAAVAIAKLEGKVNAVEDKAKAAVTTAVAAVPDVAKAA